MPAQWILAIDQGTTGTTVLVVDVSPAGVPRIGARGYAAVPPRYPNAGWVEQVPDNLFASVERSVRQALAAFAQARGLSEARAAALLQAVSISNQRETALAWQADSGAPLGPAIVWQDRRTAEDCARLVAAGHEGLLRAKTGLVADPYFSASKWMWQLRANPGALEQAQRGDVRLGTVDSYLVWRLTGGALHQTDTTNAARTGLFDIHQRRWSDELCALWGGVPNAALATVRPSDAGFGHTKACSFLPDDLPIVGVLGDQHAALIGQGCCAEGLSKVTLGTGGFALLHTGDTPRATDRSLIQTIAYDFSGACRYALEGSTFVAGALFEWLCELGIAASPAEITTLANSVSDAGGAMVVPALSGLGAPHWRPEARGLLTGLGRQTGRAELSYAALEGVALQTAELLGHMAYASGKQVAPLRMDGGAAGSDLLLQMHADLLDCEVARPASVEATGLGAALAGAVGLGLKREGDLLGAFEPAAVFRPAMSAAKRSERFAAWKRAVVLA